MFSVAMLCSATASAGSGPWVVGEGNGTIYSGLESQRLTNLAITVDDERLVIPVGEGLSTFGVKAIGAWGLTNRIEIEGEVPWYRVHANRSDSQLCADLGLRACATTKSIGLIRLSGKYLVFDELLGAPVSVSIGGEARFGDFTEDTRARITNVGEGTFDLGTWLSVGRTGALGSIGSYSVYTDLGYRYRFAKTTTFPNFTGNLRVPGSEYEARIASLVSPNPYFGVGPAVNVLWRPRGLDWGEVDLTDPDRLSALRVFNLRAGGQVILRSRGGISVSASAFGTVWTVNNPSDVFVVSLGAQVPIALKDR
jgi:hypothetical protein